MKSKRTLIFAGVFVVFAFGVYFLDYRHEQKSEQQKELDLQVLKFDPAQINMLEIVKKDEKIVLQKSDAGWALLEPIQDKADSSQIEDLVKSITEETMMDVAKDSPNLSGSDLAEYGLDQPLATYNIKNNLGQSKKISVGTQKNFEGNAFLRVDTENKIYVASAVWFTKSENKLIYYREKRLYRGALGDVTRITINSLSDQFELKRGASGWTSNQTEHVLDQNKVRETLKKISEMTIQDYVFDGEPSSALIAEKGLAKKPIVHIELATNESAWSVDININDADNAVYALTDRPTRLLKLDPSSWEFFGNLSLDSMRDRVSVTRFNLDLVDKVYVKYQNQEGHFEKTGDTWKPVSVQSDRFDGDAFLDILHKIHDLEISEFIDKKMVDRFQGNEMIILKSAENNLVYQLNWGPEFKMKKMGKEKEYYYARTQISPSIFAIEKERIQKLGLEKVLKPKEKSNDKSADN